MHQGREAHFALNQIKELHCQQEAL
jgi:hypothetical protein